MSGKADFLETAPTVS